MALTNKLWALLAAIGCAIIWLALLFDFDAGGPKPEVDNGLGKWRPPPPNALAIAEGRVGSANNRLRMLEVRDSVLSVGKDSGSFALIVDPRLAPEVRERITTSVESRWKALAIPPGRRVIAAVIADTSDKPHQLPVRGGDRFGVPIETFLPGPGTNGACVSILRTRFIARSQGSYARQYNNTLSTPETINSLLSPCAFFAAFGEPGPDVRNWLLNKQLSASRFAAWNEASGEWSPSKSAQVYGPNLVDVLALNADPTWRLRKYVSPQGIACLANEPNTCGDLLLRTRRVTDDSAWRSNVVVASGTTLSAYYLPQVPMPLGPSDGWILSEMVRTLGRDRFQKFWTSTLPVAEAFRQAAGEDVQTWTHSWAVRTYGVARVGPYLPMLGLSTGLLIVLVGFAGAAFIESRRRVA